MSNLQQFKVCLAAGQIRYASLRGRPHIVVPCVMLTEGVHNGSAGPIYYPLEEIQSSTPLWNGRPVVLGHPTNGNSPVSAAAYPHIYEQSFGKVFNTRLDGNKLKAELWLDTDLTEQKAPKVLEALKSGKNIEVSTGLFTSDDPRPGVWNGEHYHSVTHDYRPDHLAILLDQPGACSWSDGCGIRANSQKEDSAMQIEEPLTLPTINEHGHGYPPPEHQPNFYREMHGPDSCDTSPHINVEEEEPLDLPTIDWKS
jgi:hypothetical protein